MEGFITLILDPLEELYLKIKQFFPNLLAMITILIIGYVVTALSRAVLLRLLRALNFDSWCDKMGFTALMRKGDVWSKPTDAVGYVFFWFLLIIFMMVGLNALNIPAIDNLISQFFLYLPRALSAVVILFIGYLVSGFLSRAVLISAVNTGYHSAKLLSEAVRLLLVVLSLSMALEQLQVAPTIVVAAFSIIFGGIVIALSISFGVGGIEAARRLIEKGPEQSGSGEDKGDVEHI